MSLFQRSIRFVRAPSPAGFVFRSALLLAVFGTLATIPDAVNDHVVEPLMRGTAWVLSVILNMVGVATTLDGSYVRSLEFSVEIIPECTGFYALPILLALTLAFPVPLRHRAVGIGLGLLVVFVVNQVRLTSLFLLGRSFPAIFEDVHLYVWQGVFLLVIVLYWYEWARRASGRAAREEAAPPPPAEPS